MSIPRSAAIIPFALETTTQTVYILLARIADSRNHRTDVWGDLGGTREVSERPEETAAREFIEESLAVVKQFECAEQVAQELLAGRFFLRVRLHFTHPSLGSYCKDFYLKEVPFDPSISHRFTEMREALLRVPEGIDRSLLPEDLRNHPALKDSPDCVVAPHFLEKSGMQWFSMDHCVDILQNMGQFGDVRIRSSFAPALRLAVTELMRFVPLT